VIIVRMSQNTYIVLVKCRVMVVKVGGVCSKHCFEWLIRVTHMKHS